MDSHSTSAFVRKTERLSGESNRGRYRQMLIGISSSTGCPRAHGITLPASVTGVGGFPVGFGGSNTFLLLRLPVGLVLVTLGVLEALENDAPVLAVLEQPHGTILRVGLFVHPLVRQV